ncbi:MAG TPA: hypothetical protein VLF43_03590 [Candidatus Saccharimonadales bacterium]|nr:hypothetical protein [Candidatus Saccharimonadales bacterium]
MRGGYGAGGGVMGSGAGGGGVGVGSGAGAGGGGVGVGDGVGVGLGLGLGAGGGVLDPEREGAAGAGVVVSVLAGVELSFEAVLSAGGVVLSPATLPKLISLLPCLLVLLARVFWVLVSLLPLSDTSASTPPTNSKAMAIAILPSTLYLVCHSLNAVKRRRIGIQTP